MHRKIKIVIRVLVTVEAITLTLPLLAMWAFGTLLIFVTGFLPYLIILLPIGFGLFSALMLALRYEEYAYDKIPLWVRIGLVVGVSASIMLTDFSVIPINWRHGGAYPVAKDLYQSGIGAVISVVTCLCAVFWVRKNIDKELNL